MIFSLKEVDSSFNKSSLISSPMLTLIIKEGLTYAYQKKFQNLGNSNSLSCNRIEKVSSSMMKNFKGPKCLVFSRIEQDHLFKRTLRNSNPKVSR